ncbi:MAG: hypothetical protein ACTJE5_24315, partial [Pseudomonas helleri]
GGVRGLREKKSLTLLDSPYSPPAKTVLLALPAISKTSENSYVGFALSTLTSSQFRRLGQVHYLGG